MQHIFSLEPNETLSEGIQKLSKKDITGLSYDSVVQRGYEYFNSGEVYPNIEIGLGNFELEVAGSYGEYNVNIKEVNKQVFTSCNCPYEAATCKHIIASLLHLKHNIPVSELQKADITKATIAKAKQVENDFEIYVRSLSIEKLQELVLDFAPDYFRKEVALQQKMNHGNIQTVENNYDNAVVLIQSLFDKEWYNISKFEVTAAKAMDKLRPFWQLFPDRITDELVDFMQNVEAAFEENQLYEDYNDSAYEGETEAKYIAEFIKAIPAENQTYACRKIGQTYKNLDYAVFDNLKNELQVLMPGGVWRRWF